MPKTEHCSTDPLTKLERILGEAPPEQFVAALRKRQVDPVFVGRVVVATWKPHESVVLETIRDLGLELQVIFNKEAVMVLPAGINKASGLKAVVKELGFSLHNVVGVGDAENDHAFMSVCECSVAVANALPSIKERADVVTRNDHGRGVIGLAKQLLADDLHQVDANLTRHHILIGTSDREELRTPPYGINVLLAGTSGSGKTTLATGLLERLVEHNYQVCIFDPEGDYQNLEGAVVLGSPQGAPQIDEILQLLEKPETHRAGSNSESRSWPSVGMSFRLAIPWAGLVSSRADLRFANCVPVSIRGLWESRSFRSNRTLSLNCLISPRGASPDWPDRRCHPRDRAPIHPGRCHG